MKVIQLFKINYISYIFFFFFRAMTGRKRSGSGSKRPLKEKVVQIYETFFKVNIKTYMLKL